MKSGLNYKSPLINAKDSVRLLKENVTNCESVVEEVCIVTTEVRDNYESDVEEVSC